MDGATWLETTRALTDLGWRVTLVDIGPSGTALVRGIEVHHVPRPNLYLVGQAVFHAQLLPLVFGRDRPDAVIYHQMSALWLLPARFIRALMGRRHPLLVLDLRTLHMPPRGNQTMKDRLRGAYYRLVQSLGGFGSDGQLAITPRLAEAAAIPKRHLWGTWPSGVRPDDFAHVSETRKWPEENEIVRLVYIGSLMHERNLDALCRAVLAVNKGGRRFELTLVGDGTARVDLERLAATTDGQVRMVGAVHHGEIPAILGRYHVGVLPFPDEEKFRVSSPIKLFEYLASGMPILATAIACHTDVVDESVTFWAYGSDGAALEETLEAVWRSRAALQAMGGLAQQVATQYTWAEAAAKLDVALRYGLELSATKARESQVAS